MEQADVIIVGGGLTGATLATALSRALPSASIVVLEARAGRNPRFAGELIHPSGVDVLDEHGLLAVLAATSGVHVAGFAVVPEGGAMLRLPYAEIVGKRPTGFATEHHAMVEKLREQAAMRPGVELRTGARVMELLRQGERVVGVRTADGDELRARLVLVAEGRHSRLRRLAGIDEEARLVSYTAAVLVEDTALPEARHGHIFLGGPGPILAYPIAERGDGGAGERATTVRMCLDVPTELLEAHKGSAAHARLLRERYAPTVPEPLRSGLLASLDRRPPEIAANYAIYTRRCVGSGYALVGESGGCSHPLTAAGMTVCLNDVRLLCEELVRTALDDERGLAAALLRYQARRYRFVRAREVLADALYEVFLGADPGARAIREGIFGYWRGGARARSASMALLSGAESGLGSFLGEYLRVVVRSTGAALAGRAGDASLGGRARSLGALAGKAFGKARIVAGHVRAGTMR